MNPPVTEAGNTENNADFYCNRGKDHHKQNQFDEAIADFSHAIALDPDKADFYYQRGLAYHEKYHEKSDYTQAIADFSRAIELDPNNANFYFQRGIT